MMFIYNAGIFGFTTTLAKGSSYFEVVELVFYC
jgi:hypothetical protein